MVVLGIHRARLRTSRSFSVGRSMALEPPPYRVHYQFRLFKSHHVSSILHDDELRAWDIPSQVLAEFYRRQPILPAHNHQRRHADRTEIAHHIEMVAGAVVS